IKRKGHLDGKAFHYHPADTIREAPTFVVVALKDVPGLLDIIRVHPDYLGDFLSQQTGTKTEGPSKLPPHFHQGEQLVNDIIRGYKRLCVRLEPRIRHRVVGVIRHKSRKPGSGINKDHASP